MTATLIVMIGPPGAGKTTWRTRHTPPGATVVSLDELRAVFSPCGCSGDHSVNAAANEHALALTRGVLDGGGTVVWDITSYKQSFRRRLLAVAGDCRARTVAVVLLPPVEVALRRNATRDPRVCGVCGTARRVPDQTIRAMHAQITADLPGLYREGWHTVHYRPPADAVALR
ncbi:ATP-binding protein [Amycolatopsis suaedae]|uniref:ATP-binding protein n=1 Tax=Amycolatopsis suaedae TaxID=2510978 RepID=A0A4Q7J1Y3_9PSEU|nr:ATP-binding protein [Amycolatopsis suaedae]RZQ60867.1 ATP-binding protein [Amycolatopsis suaedae]